MPLGPLYSSAAPRAVLTVGIAVKPEIYAAQGVEIETAEQASVIDKAHSKPTGVIVTWTYH